MAGKGFLKPINKLYEEVKKHQREKKRLRRTFRRTSGHRHWDTLPQRTVYRPIKKTIRPI